MRVITRDSMVFSMYASRLLSCPTYFSHSVYSGAASYGVPTFCRYQFTTMSCPSGFSDGHRNSTSLSRISFTSGSSARDNRS